MALPKVAQLVGNPALTIMGLMFALLLGAAFMFAGALVYIRCLAKIRENVGIKLGQFT